MSKYRLSPERLEEIRFANNRPGITAYDKDDDIDELLNHIDALEAEISRYELKKDDESNVRAGLFNDLTTLRSQAETRENELKEHIKELEKELEKERDVAQYDKSKL